MSDCIFNGIQTEELDELLTLEKEEEQNHLVIFNDDFNTFDHVIDTLIKVCKHNIIQAEQCTHIIHYKGKCSVKVGEYAELEKMCTSILEKGITAEIQ